jgi:transcriptional regulator CtsR
MNTAYRTELLQNSLDGRIREVTEYQVNIDCFRLAIDMVGDEASMQPFKEHLQELLSSSLIEQRKAQIMLDVVSKQLQDTK